MFIPLRRRPKRVPPPAHWMVATFLVLCLANVAGAPAIPGIAPVHAPPKNQASAGMQIDWSKTPPDTLIAALRGKLAAANEAIAQAKGQAGGAASTGAATQAEITEEGFLQQQMVRVYQRQIDSLLKLKSLQQRRGGFEHEAANWAGMAVPPPYSFFVVDGLRQALRFQKAHILALMAMDAAMEQESVRRDEVFEETGEKLRQANERLENDNGGNPRLVWLRDLEARRNRLAEARVEGIRIEQRTNAEEMAETRQRLELTERRLNTIKDHIAFPSADKEQVRVRLATERQRLQAEWEALAPLAEANHQALDAATAKLGQGRTTLAENGSPQHIADLENELELRREQAENTDIELQTLTRLIDSTKMREKIWDLRWSSVEAKDPVEVRQAYEMIDKLQMELKPIREYMEQRLKLTKEQIYDMEKQMLDPGPASTNAHGQSLHELFVGREASYQRMLGGLEHVGHMLDLWKQDLDDRHQAEPWPERAREWLAQLREDTLQFWQFELFAAEDTIEVEGQPITGKRSITVGKVATALFILVVGLWISSKLTSYAERLAITRGGMDAGSAHIARRWILFLIGAILVMTSLIMVKIPLTVFAFAGGAVAIGAGFGMQNLLKNLISGLMLLLERPFRPGDLIEVAGIRGRVIDIGVRSSHIRDGNGIETLIPNSTFVEENVTNWTLSSQAVRIVVKLGVAYGSPVREMTDLLLETADRHGLVQDDPPPQVLFEDFGSDALQFGLYVWVEIKPGVDWRVIASDLRYMLHKTLLANGIVMAFPQRDIHVDAAQPLQVRLVRESEA